MRSGHVSSFIIFAKQKQGRPLFSILRNWACFFYFFLYYILPVKCIWITEFDSLVMYIFLEKLQWMISNTYMNSLRNSQRPAPPIFVDVTLSQQWCCPQNDHDINKCRHLGPPRRASKISWKSKTWKYAGPSFVSYKDIESQTLYKETELKKRDTQYGWGWERKRGENLPNEYAEKPWKQMIM